jgi:hypothetical protein
MLVPQRDRVSYYDATGARRSYIVLSFVSILCCFCLYITEYEQIRGEGGGRKIFLGPGA